jgi:TPR repeat protein
MFITSLQHAEAVSAKLRKRFPRAVKIERCRDMVAVIYGYRDWDHFAQSPREPLSAFDNEIDAAERKARLEEQSTALTGLGLSYRVAKTFVGAIKPTALTIEHSAYVKSLEDRRLIRDVIDSHKRVRRDVSRKSDPQLLANLAAAYANGDFEEATYAFGLVASSSLKVPAAAVIAILEPFSDIDPRALHHMALTLLLERPGKIDLRQATLYLLVQCTKFPEDRKRGWVLTLLGEIANGDYGGPSNPALALEYYRKAVVYRVGPAALKAGEIFEKSEEFRDRDKAKIAYRQAADLGDPAGWTSLAAMALREVGGHPSDAEISEIAKLLHEAAVHGDIFARSVLEEDMVSNGSLSSSLGRPERFPWQ